MARKGSIQNEEVLYEVASNGGEFFIPCRDRDDAHSKNVSLNNAKQRMPEFQQRLVRVQKAQMDNIWGVKVSLAQDTPIWKIIDGVPVAWAINENVLPPAAQRIVSLMVKDGLSDEEILSTLSEEKEDLVRKEIAKKREEN